MELTFLGAAMTVTGSQFLLETRQARILVDCGMFQGGARNAIRNRVPLGYEPRDLDAILLTHAHLDHCGLIPLVVREGFRGPVRATAGTIELARLVLEDSGRLQEDFARREARWERRNPDKAAADDERELRQLEVAIDEAEAGDRIGEASGREAAEVWPVQPAAPGIEAVRGADAGWSEQVIEAQRAEATDGTWDRAALPRGRGPEPADVPDELRIELDAPLYTEADAVEALRRFRPIAYDGEEEVAPGIHATFLDAGHILGSAIIRLRVADEPGAPERVIVFSGDLGKRNTSIIRDPSVVAAADYVLVESTYGGREHEPETEAGSSRPTGASSSCPRSPSGGRRSSSGRSTASSRPARSRRCRSTSTRRWLARRRRSIVATPSTTTSRRGRSSRPATRPSTTRSSGSSARSRSRRRSPGRPGRT
jgi:ribonuclease BN (tRNA processing enzyme)